ncbi:TPA: hypothetical protein QHW61_005235 [Klebsiella oxytoca]|nr:hypothetical protein [Klebsiella oxytoca]
MLTHQVIKDEIEELKRLLLDESLVEIPSFWGCIWPGLVCILWFLLSSYLSYGISDYSSSLDRLASMIFAGGMGVFLTITIANTRSLFLSLPEVFRRESKTFQFLSGKCKAYVLTILCMFTLFAFGTSYIGWNVVAFCVLTIFGIVITVMIMTFDLGRYQLATLTSVIESIKTKKNEPMQ